MPKVYFNGKAGKIEGMYYQPKVLGAKPAALILHPHPLYGGTMNNKVTFNIFKTLAELDFATLRINFRGVGNSNGTFDNGIGEVEDASVALNGLQDLAPEAKGYWIIGFSFGAYIAMQIATRRPEIKCFIAVSPPVTKYNFNFCNTCPVSGLVVQGGKDQISRPEDTERLVEQMEASKDISVDYYMIEKGDHFFSGTEEDLYKCIKKYAENYDSIGNGGKIFTKAKKPKGKKFSGFF